jgi:hypothetical protein
MGQAIRDASDGHQPGSNVRTAAEHGQVNDRADATRVDAPGANDLEAAIRIDRRQQSEVSE